MSDAERHNDEVILAKLDGFRELFEERAGNIEATLMRVETQVLKTNGRVNVLELESAEIRGKAKVSGILWGSLVSVAVTVAGFFITRTLET